MHLVPAQLLLVVGGLVLRSAASGQLHLTSHSAGGETADPQQLYGAALTLVSALTYSLLNLLYDYTVQTTPDPPAHPVIMAQMARVGLLANGLYTAAFTVRGPQAWLHSACHHLWCPTGHEIRICGPGQHSCCSCVSDHRGAHVHISAPSSHAMPQARLPCCCFWLGCLSLSCQHIPPQLNVLSASRLSHSCTPVPSSSHIAFCGIWGPEAISPGQLMLTGCR